MNSTISLKGWKLGRLGADQDWIKIEDPLDVHSVLIDKGIIPDPVYAYNDECVRWVEKETWVYKCFFELSREDIKRDVKAIIFEGLDTYAKVYVNSSLVAIFDNMFIEHTLELTNVHEGKNELEIVFPPFSSIYSQKTLPEGFWINYSTERAYARKAGYSFGWDWTPAVLTVGVWKKVRLLLADKVELVQLNVRAQLSDDLKTGHVTLLPELLGSLDPRFTYKAELIKDGNLVDIEQTSNLCFEVKNPKLWYPMGYGKQEMYTLKLAIIDEDGIVVSEQSKDFAFRKVEFIRHDDNGTPMLLTRVNGKNVFSKGANWVPVSNRPGSVSDEYYEKLIKMAADAHMNTLVIWGGGIYERDYFYELCDRYGIMIWQYFMFACGEYPDWDEAFLDNVKYEIQKIVPKLDSHPSVIFYLGNVEGEMICQKIGLQRTMYGDRLFKEYIPAWLNEIGTDREYESSSPFGGELVNSQELGDRHNWDVWFSGIPYQDFRLDSTRFASEFGLHAAPVLETIKRYTKKDDIEFTDYEYDYFNRDSSPALMMHYMKQHIGNPKDMKQYIEYSMLVQAEALKYGCEHYRRNYPYCAGSTIWQLNDCCPCQSWSMIDVDLIPKASYWYSKRFFSDVSMSLKECSANERELWIVNNSLEEFSDSVIIKVQDFFGSVIHEEKISFSVPADCARCIRHIAVGGRFYPNVIIPNRIRHYLISAELETHKEYKENTIFGEFKDVNMPKAELSVSYVDGKLEIEAMNFVKFLQIIPEDYAAISIEDNYFDLLPGEKRRISLTSATSQQIEIKAFNGNSLFIRI